MNRIFVHGIGAVSPAGWGRETLRAALAKGEALPLQALAREGWPRPLHYRPVPAPAERPSCLHHPRLRRASPISHYAVAAGLEALGTDAPEVQSGRIRLGVIVCVLSGCVNYSRRFYEETLKDPATASPILFPETVFNAPASHLAAVLGSTTINYTMVGDPGTFLQALALAADWLKAGRVAGCLIIGAEEFDWPTADAFQLFSRSLIIAAGAGALYLRSSLPVTGSSAELVLVTDAHNYLGPKGRVAAAQKMRQQLPGGREELLCDSQLNLSALDRAEREAWRDWSGARLSPKVLLGEGLAAGSAWQCVSAVDALTRNVYRAATVSVVGCNQQAIGARFRSIPEGARDLDPAVGDS